MSGYCAWNIGIDSDGETYVVNNDGMTYHPGSNESVRSPSWRPCEFTDEICYLLEDLGYFYNLDQGPDSYEIKVRGQSFMSERNYEVIARDRLSGINERLDMMITDAKHELREWNRSLDLYVARRNGII